MGAHEEHAETTAPAVEEMSYTDASSELDEIVRFFEDRDVDVDQLVGRLVRATAIIEELDKRLRRTRVQVEQLVPKLTRVLADNGQLDDETDEDVDDETDDADDETDVDAHDAVVDVPAASGGERAAPRSRGEDADAAALF